MAFFPCISSVETLTRKIANNLTTLTKSKSKFYKGVDHFVSQVENYNDKKATIVIEIIKIELTNSQNKSEIRYSYLFLLDKLILINVKFLRIAFEVNLLSYIIQLSDFANYRDLFNYYDEEEAKLSLSGLAASSLKNWYDKYSSLNEGYVLLLKQYKYNLINSARSSLSVNELDEFCYSVARESDEYKISTSNNDGINSNRTKHEKISEESNFVYNLNVPTQVESTLNHNILVTPQIEDNATQSIDKIDQLDIKTNSSIEDKIVDNKMHTNVETYLKIQNLMKNKYEENNGFQSNLHPKEDETLNQIKELNEKYSKLKEKYLLLVQKNDCLQSRLDFYENYSFSLKNSDKKRNANESNTIFKDVLDIIHSVEGNNFINNFKKLVSVNDWVLFEDNTVQIGLKCYFERTKGNIYIYFGNKLPTRLEDFSVEFKLWNISHEILEIKREEPLPYYISGKQQICAKFTVNCNDIYFGIPTLIIKFLLPDSSTRNVELPFPLVLSKFSDGIDCDSETILKLWHSDVFLMSQSSFQFDLKTTNIESISELVENFKLGNTFKLLSDSPDKDNESPKRIYLFGSILDHYIIIQLQLHGPSSDKYTLRVRSDSGMLSSSILSILNLQISETIL
ncbi:adaptin AP complex subunit alpha [Cryptosporidium bovis]|uniref:adaptin AP complex subunit alpha n=1 Tax=Cryptosporidium bovis TaxID=310047 RepID=UPI00351A10FE|nr:adaptin AP complex subunit alpha [Cryptosporidium bovis]